MSIYKATVTREGKWWVVAIPALEGLTQARRLSEAELMAREYVAVALDLPLEDVEVSVTVSAIGTVAVDDALKTIRDDRARAAQLEQEATAAAQKLAKDLASQNVPLRDIGAILGVTFQRAHQLVAA